MAMLLCQALDESGFQSQSASNGVEGLAMASNADLLLVDVMMPELNGFEMVAELRQKGVKKPVIFLTAKDSSSDVVNGLDAGGDDYIVKPFKLDELLARVRAHLRRSLDNAVELTWEDLTLDISKRTTYRAGQEVFLSSTEFALLEYLVRNAGEAVPKSILLREIWRDDGYRSENIVELYVNYVRKKTECYNLPRIVHTVRGKGYVLAKDPPQP